MPAWKEAGIVHIDMNKKGNILKLISVTMWVFSFVLIFSHKRLFSCGISFNLLSV